jgi:hypothetical protein
MNTSNVSSVTAKMCASRCLSPVGLALLCMAAAMAQGCSTTSKPEEFASPDEAVQSLTTALRSGNTERLLAIFGSEGEEIIFSGDEFQDKARYQKFIVAYDEKHYLDPDEDDEDTVMLVIGKNDWPFPVPIVRENDRWAFDADAGKEEILNRRIGENELSAIEVCKAIVDAQRDFALRDPNGDGVHEYAQQFPSDPDKRNGLFWPTKEGEEPSPLGDEIEAAAAEGYHRRAEGPTPYHGYYYRILLEQGRDAPGGAVKYIVDGKMILGFGLVAYPADYGNSGIMTFITNAEGVVYQRDLGDDTEKLGQDMKAFNPGRGWRKAE